MIVKAKHITIIVSLLLPLLLAGQPNERTGYYEQLGEELVSKAADKIKSYETLVINFSYITESSQHNTYETTKGVITLKGDKYNISLEDHIYISDGNTVWACLKDVKEIHISFAEDIEQSMNPIFLLDDFQKHYRAKLIRQEDIPGELVNLVDVIPNKAHSFFKYRLAIQESDYMLHYIKAYDRHGGTYKIQFDDVQKNVDIPAEKFVFNKEDYPDMDIIDLR